MHLVARGFIPAGVRSAPIFFTTAAQPNGDKSPHHRDSFNFEVGEF